MGGYIIAAVMIGPIKGTDVCYGILCWRWPLLVEWFMLVPFAIAVHFVPENHLVMRIGKIAEATSEAKLASSPEPIEITDIENDVLSPTDQDEKDDLFLGFENLESNQSFSNPKTVNILIILYIVSWNILIILFFK